MNEPNADGETLAYLLQYDSVAGVLAADVDATRKGLRVNGEYFALCSCSEPADIPWADFGVDIVIESSGRFRKRSAAAAHLEAGARPCDRLGAEPRRGRDHLRGCQRRCLQPRPPHGCVERFLHDELPRADGAGTRTNGSASSRRS